MNLKAKPIKRLFTFGCSFTKYFWPTWADILNQEISPLEYYNLALPGSGNAYIAHSFHLNNVKHNFGPDDLIIICWSNIFRADWFHNFEWSQEGNVYASHGKYNSQIPDELKHPTIFLARDLVNIYGVMKACEHSGCNFKHLTMLPMFEESLDGKKLIGDEERNCRHLINLINFIEPRLEKSFTEVLGEEIQTKWYDYFPEDEFQKPGLWDRHPLPTHHSKYLSEIFSDTIFDKKVMESVNRAEKQAVDILSNTDRDTDKFQEYFESQDTIVLC